MSKTAETSAEIEQQRLYTDDDLAAIGSFADAVNAATQRGQIESAEDFGNGFTVTDKALLCGKEMLLLDWRFNDGDFGDFVSVTAVTADNLKVVFNDGSTGVCEQLQRITARRGGRTGNLHLKKGLRVSEYENEYGKSKTYYLDI